MFSAEFTRRGSPNTFLYHIKTAQGTTRGKSLTPMCVPFSSKDKLCCASTLGSAPRAGAGHQGVPWVVFATKGMSPVPPHMAWLSLGGPSFTAGDISMLGSSRSPPCPGESPWQVLGGGARFPRRGGHGSEQVWESGAVLPPPAPFTAQTVTWFMAAEGHCTGSINPVSQRLLPGKLAPVQSRQEGLAARTASSFPSSVARGVLGYPLLSAGSDKRWHWERVSCLGKSLTAIAAPKIREILPGTVLALLEGQRTVLGSSKIQSGTGRSTGAAHSCCAPSSSDTCRIWGDTLMPGPIISLDMPEEFRNLPCRSLFLMISLHANTSHGAPGGFGQPHPTHPFQV